jgi:hypothetical protein
VAPHKRRKKRAGSPKPGAPYQVESERFASDLKPKPTKKGAEAPPECVRPIDHPFRVRCYTLQLNFVLSFLPFSLAFCAFVFYRLFKDYPVVSTFIKTV